ncbi:hypothetical protein C0J52_08664 [Blattella germanica]|nr:hypothetical protein C0J52_08664 [Blattella germanica]
MQVKKSHFLVLLLVLNVAESESVFKIYNWTAILPCLDIKTCFEDFFKDVGNSNCSAHFQYYINELENLLVNGDIPVKDWVLRMFDSSTKIPEGILMGQSIYLGNFDECIEIENIHVPTALEPFNGQHCVAQFSVKATTSGMLHQNVDEGTRSLKNNEFMHQRNVQVTQPLISMSYCIPSSCTPKNFEDALNLFLLEQNVTATVNDVNCHTNKKKSLQTEDYIAIVIIALIVVLVVASTVYDLAAKGEKRELLTSFSFVKNGKKLLSTETSSDTLDAVHGMRFISMCWVLWGHRYTVAIAVPSVNFITLQDFLQDPANLFITNGTLSVDTFLFLSGLLMTYVFLKQMKNKMKGFNIPLYYLHRYIRLTPPYVIMILFEGTLLRYLTNGPLLTATIDLMAENCQKYWWRNILYINNYFDPTEMCMGQSWYLSVDMQLFWLSPLILYPLWKWPKKWNVILLSILTLAGIAAPFVSTYIGEFSPNLATGNVDKSEEVLLYYYEATYCRFGAWIIGVAFGYMIFEAKRKQAKLRSIEIVLGWIISNVAMLGALNGIHSFYLPDVHKTVLENAFYNGFFRNAWALGVGLVVFFCVTGYGGPPNIILSWKVFPTLSRLSYCMYLTHAFYQVIQGYSLKTPIYLTPLDQWPQFFGDVIVSIIMAVILTLLVESPMINLERCIFGRGGSSRQNNNRQRTMIQSAPSESNEIQDEPISTDVVDSTAINISEAVNENSVESPLEFLSFKSWKLMNRTSVIVAILLAVVLSTGYELSKDKDEQVRQRKETGSSIRHQYEVIGDVINQGAIRKQNEQGSTPPKYPLTPSLPPSPTRSIIDLYKKQSLENLYRIVHTSHVTLQNCYEHWQRLTSDERGEDEAQQKFINEYTEQLLQHLKSDYSESNSRSDILSNRGKELNRSSQNKISPYTEPSSVPASSRNSPLDSQCSEDFMFLALKRALPHETINSTKGDMSESKAISTPNCIQNERAGFGSVSPRNVNYKPLEPFCRKLNWTSSFSLISNGKHVFYIDDTYATLHSLYGLKFISNYREWYFMLIQNSPLGIDTFFVVSGVLLSYKFLKDMKSIGIQYTKNKCTDITSRFIFGYLPLHYLHRFFSTITFVAILQVEAYPRWFWLLAAMGSFYSVFGAVTFQTNNPENTPMKAAVYSCLFRNVWAMSVGWAIFACETNNGGFVQTLLTWKAFQPLSRLTYSIYLVHLPLMTAKALMIRIPIEKSVIGTISSVCGDIVLSSCIALVLVLCVELPFIRLYEIISRVRYNGTSSSEQDTSTTELQQIKRNQEVGPTERTPLLGSSTAQGGSDRV